MRHTHSEELPYTGINVSRIPVGGGFAGLLIVVAIVVIGLVGLPPVRWFLAGSIGLGLVMALIRRLADR